MKYNRSLDRMLMALYYGQKAQKETTAAARKETMKRALAALIQASKEADAAQGMRTLEANLRKANPAGTQKVSAVAKAKARRAALARLQARRAKLQAECEMEEACDKPMMAEDLLESPLDDEPMDVADPMMDDSIDDSMVDLEDVTAEEEDDELPEDDFSDEQVQAAFRKMVARQKLRARRVRAMRAKRIGARRR